MCYYTHPPRHERSVHVHAPYTWAHPPTWAPYTAFRLITSLVRDGRYTTGDKKTKQIPIPTFINSYNTNMGAVDIDDQLHNTYRTHVKGLRRWPPVLFWLLGVSVSNSCLAMAPKNPGKWQSKRLGHRCCINTPTEGDVYSVFSRPRSVEETGDARPANDTGTVIERDRGGHAHARAVRRLDAPERYWVTIQYRRAEADPARGRAARVLDPRAVLV